MRQMVLLMGSLSVLAGQASAQQAGRPLVLTRLTTPIEVDGHLQEGVWATIAPLPLVQFQPTAGAAPSSRAEIRIAYDHEAIYASGRFWVNDPSEVRAGSLYRDRIVADDLFRVMLDTFNDRENAVAFITNPAGNRVDYALSGDGAQFNYDWNSHWDAASQRHPDGWSAEMRIPLSSLRFRVIDGQVVMRLLVERWSVARNEMVTFPAVSPDFNSAHLRSSLAHEVVLEGVRPSQPVYITPYTLGGVERVAQRATGAPAWGHETRDRIDAGVDLKYGIGNDLALDVTVNTDFAQVEADDQQVNLSRFSLFFPEKRQFFQERAGLFNFLTGGIGDNSRLFHSRRIGLDNTGNPLQIYGGGRLVGRAGGWDLGLLAMQVEDPTGEGSEHFGVYRLRRPILNTQSYVGGIATMRLGSGRTDLAVGLDAQVRTLRNDFLTVQLAQTFDNQVESRGFDAGMARVAYERRASRGLVYSLNAKWSGPDHDPAIGFNPRRDYSLLGFNLRYGWYPGARTVFRNMQPSLLGSGVWRNDDKRMDSGSLTFYWNYELKSGFFGFVNAFTQREELRVPLGLGGGVTAPAGVYETQGSGGFVGMPSSLPFRVNVSWAFSELYGGRSRSVTLGPTWNVSQHLELGGEIGRQRVHWKERNEHLAIDQYRLRVRAALDTRLSLNTYVQYNRLFDQVLANVRLRYNFSEGRDLYIAFNDRMNTDRERLLPMEPELPFSQERSFIVKYSHTFAR